MALVSRRERRPWWMTPFAMEPMGDIFMDRVWPEWPQVKTEEEWVPSMNLAEKEGKYLLTAELPGMKKEDINVMIDGRVLTVSGKKETHKEEEGADYYMRETSSGSFSRSMRLPTEVEEEKIEAKFEDGVLSLTLPHKDQPKTKKISIK